MHRHALTDGQWRRLQKVLPRQRAGPQAKLGDRLFIEAVLFRARTGLPWRDLPERFGPWKSGKALIGDTGYDSNRFLQAVRDKGMKPVIHSKPERKKKHRLVRRLYRMRYLVEVFFHHLKRFRAVATRYDKTARNYLALVHLACSQILPGN